MADTILIPKDTPDWQSLLSDVQASVSDAENYALSTSQFTDRNGDSPAKGAKGWAQDASVSASNASTSETNARQAADRAKATESIRKSVFAFYSLNRRPIKDPKEFGTDLSGRGNTLTPSIGQTSPSRVTLNGDEGISLNGVDQGLMTQNAPDLSFATEFTLGVAVDNTTFEGGNDRVIIGKSIRGNLSKSTFIINQIAGENSFGFRLQTDTNDGIFAKIADGDGTTGLEVLYVTWDGSTLRWYRNGSQVGSGSLSGNNVRDKGVRISIGSTSDPSNPTGFYNGDIYHAFIGDKAISSEEINLLNNKAKDNLIAEFGGFVRLFEAGSDSNNSSALNNNETLKPEVRTGTQDRGYKQNFYSAPEGEFEKLTTDGPIVDGPEEARVLLEPENSRYIMMYTNTVANPSQMGIATAPISDILTWTKSNSNPVIDPQNFADLNGSLRGQGFMRDQDGNYYVAIVDNFGNDGDVNILSSDLNDPTTWNFEKKITINDGDGALTTDFVRVGMYYYLFTQIANNKPGRDAIVVHYTKDLTGNWNKLYDAPILYGESSTKFVSTFSMIKFEDHFRFGWEEREQNRDATGQSINFHGTMSTSRLLQGKESVTQRYSSNKSITGLTNTSFDNQETVPSILDDTKSKSVLTAVKVIGRVTAESGESVYLNVSQNLNERVSVQSSSGATEEIIESDWAQLDHSNQIDTIEVRHRVTGGSYDLDNIQLLVQKVPQLEVNPKSPDIVTGGSGWDSTGTAENQEHYFGGHYLYSFYEAPLGTGNRIGLARKKI